MMDEASDPQLWLTFAFGSCRVKFALIMGGGEWVLGSWADWEGLISHLELDRL